MYGPIISSPRGVDIVGHRSPEKQGPFHYYLNSVVDHLSL